jgi:hypothetical protein
VRAELARIIGQHRLTLQTIPRGPEEDGGSGSQDGDGPEPMGGDRDSAGRGGQSGAA